MPIWSHVRDWWRSRTAPLDVPYGLRLTPRAQAAWTTPGFHPHLHLRALQGDPISFLHVETRPSQDSAPQITAEPDISGTLAGLSLDFDGDRWKLTTDVRVSAQHTPNPDGRLYTTQTRMSNGHITYTRTSTHPPTLARLLLRHEGIDRVFVREHTLSILRRPGQPWAEIDGWVREAVRAHRLSGDGLLLAEKAPELSPELAKRLHETIEARIRPRLQADGGDMTLLSLKDGVARVKLVGACHTCPAQQLTLRFTVEKALKTDFPDEIQTVEAILD